MMNPIDDMWELLEMILVAIILLCVSIGLGAFIWIAVFGGPNVSS